MMYLHRKTSPQALAIWGVIALLLSSFSGFISVKELLVLPSEPQHMSISTALSKASEKRLWVILDDIQWDCDHVYSFERNRSDDTYIVFTDKDKTVLGLALFSGKKDCKTATQGEVAGVFEVSVKGTNGAKLYQLLADDGFDVAIHKTNGTLLSLCTFCGRKNSLIGVALSAIFLAMGVLLFVPLMRFTKARKRVRHFKKRDVLHS
jgi:hypothetical protein